MESISLNPDHDPQKYNDINGYKYSLVYIENSINVHKIIYELIEDYYNHLKHLNDDFTVKDLKNFLKSITKEKCKFKYQKEARTKAIILLNKIDNWNNNKTIEL
jgi:GTP-binding protein EngB required for normal cell division